MVREQIGPVASFKRVVIVNRLPKTRSGKVLRKTIRALADGLAVEIPPTIDDPAVIEQIKSSLSESG